MKYQTVVNPPRQVCSRGIKISIFFLIIFVITYYNFMFDRESKYEVIEIFNCQKPQKFVYPFAKSFDRKDWHDYNFIEYEKSRVGIGENGEAVILKDPAEIELDRKLFEIEGISVVVSDKISLNRSVPDVRHERCKILKYLKYLPKVSIIIIFHDEHQTVIKRTIHSIVNRSPPELIHEVILVNDASTKKELYEPLQKYFNENFKNAKIVNLPVRRGLIISRMEGARRATGEVLIFLDPHIEVNVNWLPPLIEPIVIEPRTVTIPLMDMFDPKTFKYIANTPRRRIFDWKFAYHTIPHPLEQQIHPERPAPSPIMGSAFAIRRDYFFDLGGYDEQLRNGENYELSFKLWLCGGQLLEVACSRVIHNKFHSEKLGGVDKKKNFKRLAEVWLDEYKSYLYNSDPEAYDKIDPGDLKRENLIRENLNCKPFSYMIEVVMPDQLYRYPHDDVGIFANGTIQSEANKSLCVESKQNKKPTLDTCDKNQTHPNYNQKFILTWHRDIRMFKDYDKCLDNLENIFTECHFEQGNQMWTYNLTTQQIYHPENNSCLTAVLTNRTVEVNKCDEKNVNQKWSWGYANVTGLKNWKTFGAPFIRDL